MRKRHGSRKSQRHNGVGLLFMAKDTAMAPFPHVILEVQGITARDPLPPDAAERIRDVIAATLRRVGLDGWYEVSVALTDDRAMRRANRRHRGIDASTDVLSFPQQDTPLIPLPADQAWAPHAFGDDTHAAPPDNLSIVPSHIAGSASEIQYDQAISYGTLEQPLLLGDILISMPTIVRQAATTQHHPWWEFCFLIAHGVLHLIGYDDYYEPGYQAMVAHQEAVLVELGISLH
jgi:probable rRNA maturation factor